MTLVIPADTGPHIVTLDGWFPDLDLADLKNSGISLSSASDARLLDMLETAAVYVME